MFPGMQRYYLEVKNFIENDSRYSVKFLGNISGSNYPPPKYAVIIANLTSALWLIGLLLVFMGESIFKSLKIQEPELFTTIKNNKVTTIVILFFMNSFGNSQLATGAFEIYIDGLLVYSKLQTKRLPTADDLVFALKLAGFE